MKALKFFAIMVSFAGLLGIASCGDDDGEDAQPQSKIVGTWSYDEASFDISVNGIDFIQYLITELDLTSEDALILAALFEGDFEEEEGLEGTKFAFNADGTYKVTQPGEPDENGTYALNSSETQITFTSDGESYSAQIDQFTSSLLRMKIIEEDDSEDLNEDGVNDNIAVEVLLTLVK